MPFYPGTNVWPYWVDQGTGAYPSSMQQQAWYGWNINVVTANVLTATTGTTYYDPWPQWIAQTQVTAQTTGWASSGVWDAWQPQQLGHVRAPVVISPEKEADMRRRAMITRNRSRSAQLRRNIAGRRARALLLEHLTEEQQAEYTASRSFHVETADGRRKYRIDYGLAGNVRLVKCEGDPPVKRSRTGGLIREGARFCMHVYHPDGPIPHEDNLLAQKLLIEADEREFLVLSNVS